MMQDRYLEFLGSKRKAVKATGFTASTNDLNVNLWDWQALIVQWSLQLGRSAIFADCGLGKTLMQLAWAEQVNNHTGKPVAVLCPLAVAWQTKAEAERFGIGCPVGIAESQQDVADDAGIVITNYEKLHLFDCSIFGGVVLDESSILKNFTGKIKQQLITTFRNTPFKLCCTATPAPNDYLELGNHAEFLGLMPSNEMIARWFINDSMKCGNYRLKQHGEADFWMWVSSWAVCITKPADLGEQFRDEKYTLPELAIHEHIVEAKAKDRGQLFNRGDKVSATGVHKEKRASLVERCQLMADLAINGPEKANAWGLWCHTDYEADQILKCLGSRGDGSDGIAEVRGSQPQKTKERLLRSFTNGESRVIATKPSVGGYGMNWQHCHNTACFASFSYEDWYQLIRRFLRFGQTSPVVNCHLIMSENEHSVAVVMREKERAHREMQAGMADRMGEFTRQQIGTSGGRKLTRLVNATEAPLPRWLQAKPEEALCR